MVDKSSKEEHTPFNMAMLFYVGLHDLRTLKSKAFIMGDILGYRDCLEEIFTSISFKLNEKEIDKIGKMFQETNEILQETNEHELIKIKPSLRQIDFQLIDYMHKHKMIFPKIEVKGGLADIYNKYNLGSK